MSQPGAGPGASAARRAAWWEPAGALRGSLRPPPDKSISHRAALLGAMSDGTSAVSGYLDSADTRSTLAAIEALGSGVERLRSERPGALDLRIAGVGLRGARGGEPGDPLEIDVGNAGTLIRLIGGWLAGQPSGCWRLDGDASIRRRPVDRVASPLRLMGARVSAREDSLPPLEVSGRALSGIDYELPVASAQIKSCLLLAGLLAAGPTRIVEPAPSRDHTERMLRAAGVRVGWRSIGTRMAVGGALAPREVTLEPPDSISLGSAELPGDLSSAAFALVAALIVPGSELTIEAVGLNPTRVGLLGVLNRMGAVIEVTEQPGLGAEPVGAIRVRSGDLRATRIGAAEVALTIDELPLIALLGCFAEGTTRVSGAGELRHKESDRIATVVDGLSALGADIEPSADGFSVRGSRGLRGGTIDAAGDHRLAMLGAVAGLASAEGVEVLDMDACAVSYPGFEADLRDLSSRS